LDFTHGLCPECFRDLMEELKRFEAENSQEHLNK
jgi:hypothetical protein